MIDGRIVRQTSAIIENLEFELDNFVTHDHFHILNLSTYDTILEV